MKRRQIEELRMDPPPKKDEMGVMEKQVNHGYLKTNLHILVEGELLYAWLLTVFIIQILTSV